MIALATTDLEAWRVEFPRLSPEFHCLRVKLPNRENSVYIKKNNNSLYMFLLFTRIPPRDARPRVYVCIRETGGETVKLSTRYFAARAAKMARERVG